MDPISHIAVVEDDADISRMMVTSLTEHGFRVTPARGARELDHLLSASKIDLVILDVSLPGQDGLSIWRRLRGTSAVPIIMVTARGGDTELGADDYLPKPFDPYELVSRVTAVIRRGGGMRPVQPEAPQTFLFEGWQLQLARRQLLDPSGTPRPLTGGEFNILVILCRHPRQVLSRADLLARLRGITAAAFDRSIDVQISRLRRKIESSTKQPALIKTVRHGGYVFTPQVTVISDPGA